MTSVKNKNKIYSKFCKAKDQKRKDLRYRELKIYRIILLNLTKKSKENYYEEFVKKKKQFNQDFARNTRYHSHKKT